MDEFSAAEFQAALDAAKQDAERVKKEFVEILGPGSPAYDAEWTTRYGSEDRLIFVFSVGAHTPDAHSLTSPTNPIANPIPPVPTRRLGFRTVGFIRGGSGITVRHQFCPTYR